MKLFPDLQMASSSSCRLWCNHCPSMKQVHGTWVTNGSKGCLRQEFCPSVQNEPSELSARHNARKLQAQLNTHTPLLALIGEKPLLRLHLSNFMSLVVEGNVISLCVNIIRNNEERLLGKKCVCVHTHTHTHIHVILINTMLFPNMHFPIVKEVSSWTCFYQRGKTRAWKYLLNSPKDDQIIRLPANAKNLLLFYHLVYPVGYL